MKKTLVLAVPLLLVAASAGADRQAFPPESFVPQKVIPLAAIGPHVRLPICGVTDGATSNQCDLMLASAGQVGPRVLYEVQVNPVPPTAPLQPLLGQCWLRVQFSEDGVRFAEIAKFAWAVGDVRGMKDVLPSPVGIVVGPASLMRVNVGIASTAAEDGCRAEVKVYTRDPRRGE